MASVTGSRRRVVELFAELEGLMGRRKKIRKEPAKLRPEVVLSEEIESRFEKHEKSGICVREGCTAKHEKRGLCDGHHNEFVGQRERVKGEAIAVGDDPADAANAFDDESVRAGLIFPRKFCVNPFAKLRREQARKAVAQ